MPVHEFLNDHHLQERAWPTTGLQHRRLPGALPRVRRRHPPRRPGPRVQGRWSGRCTRPTSRSSWTWSNNHTAEGNQNGPDAVHAGHRHAAYYRLVEDDKQYYMDYTGTGNSLNVRNPHTLQLIMARCGTGCWRSRGRLPIRPGLHAGQGVLRRGPAECVFDLVPAGPGDQPGESSSPSPGTSAPAAYQVGQLHRSGASGTAVPRHRAGLLAWRTTHPGRVRLPADRSWTCTSTTGRRPTRRSTFVTAHDGFTRPTWSLQREAQRSQRRGRQRRGEPQPLVELRVEGPTTTRPSWELRAASSGNFIATLLVSQGVLMLLCHGDELSRHPAGQTTTSTCRTN